MGYGDGSLFQNSQGGWTMMVTVDGKRYKRTGATKTAVRAKVSELRAQLARGEYQPPSARRGRTSASRTSGATVAELVEQFLSRDLAGKDRAPSTVSRHRWAADHINSQIGSLHASTLKVVEVERFLECLASSGLSRASIGKVRNTLSQALRAGVRRDLVDRDVARDAVIPPEAPKTVRRRSSLSPADARILLDHLPTIRNGLAFAMSLRLGLRPGEAWGLHWSDITDDHVNVTRALRRDGGRTEIVDSLKTEASARTIGLPADLVSWVGEHRRRQAEERLAARSWHDDRIVFPNVEGRPVSPSTARKTLAEVCSDLGVDVVSPNELRHSCASLLSDEGVSNELIADLLGHTTTRMVDQTYRHRLRPVVDVASRSTWATPNGSA